MLVAWYPLNGTLEDRASGNFAINNGASISNSGKLGSSYHFDGSTSYILLPDNINRVFTGGAGQFSVSFWIYSSEATIASDRSIIFGDYQTSGAININIEIASGKIRVYWNLGSFDYIFTGTDIALNTWINYIITYDGTKIKVYKNSLLGETKTITLSSVEKTSGNFYLGRDSRTGSTALNGNLNDFRVYNHALTKTEVINLYSTKLLEFDFSNFSTSDSYIYDNSGLGTNGIPTNISTDTDTKFGIASGLFNGTSSNIKVITSNNLKTLDALTVSFWEYGTNSGVPISFGASKGWNFSVTSNTLEFNVYDNGSGTYKAASGIATSSLLNSWHYIVGTFDGINAKLYYDGILQTTSAAFSGSSLSYDSTDTLFIGAKSNGETAASPYFSGKLADIRIYATAISDTAILKNYQSKARLDKGYNLSIGYLSEDNTKTTAGVLNENSVFILGNIIEPEVKTLSDGSRWLCIFSHDIRDTSTWFTNSVEAEFSVNKSNRYSLLRYISEFISSNNYYEFLLSYPELGEIENGYYNRWKQTSNPMDSASQILTGFELVGSQKWTTYNFGLTKAPGTGHSLLSTSGINSTAWWGAIGQWQEYSSGIPAADGSVQLVTSLWIRIDNTSYKGKFNTYDNGAILTSSLNQI